MDMRLSRKLALCLLLLVALGCTPAVSNQQEDSEASNLVSFTYEPTEGDIVNPERGFRHSLDRFDQNTDFSVYRSIGSSLVFAYSRLDPYRDRDLPEHFLRDLDSSFEALRRGGVKIVLRFAYNSGPYPNSEPDASLEQILRHISQLRPILQKNADVIAWLHAGFIGAWGEWHSSTNGLDKDVEAKRKVVESLANALPKERFILLRYPPDLISFFPEPLSDEQAFSGTLQSRLGFHNDCFLSSANDVGTYPGGREKFIEYLSQLTRYTPASGETCQVYQALQSCDRAIQEMERLHWTDLNISYHRQVIRNWQREGCFDEIQKRLGYRLKLKKATFHSQVQAGRQFSLSVELQNEGFAAPVNPRPFFVVLAGEKVHTFLIKEVDPRRWLPGDHRIDLQLQVPRDTRAGEYVVALWLPDWFENLRSDARYSIRFANEEVWDEEKGWNILGKIKILN